MLLLLEETEGFVVLVEAVVGKGKGVVGKVEGVEVNGVVEEEAVVVVFGRLSESIDVRVWNEKQVP